MARIRELRNPFDDYSTTSYHFRLFMAEEKGIIELPPTEGFTVGSTGFAELRNGERVYLLAETGATRVSIDNVSIETIPVTSVETRTGVATNINFMLTEPNKIKFFDYLRNAAKNLDINNFTKCTYYLELTFKGRRQEDGESLGRILDKKWLWPIYITEIDTNLTSAGAAYSVSALPYGEIGFSDTFGSMKKDITIEGSTLVELFKDLANKLNNDVKNNPTTNSDGQTVKNPNLKNGVKYYFDFSNLVNNDGNDESVLELVSKEKILNRAESFSDFEFVENGDKKEITFSAGVSINDMVDMLMSISKYAAKIAKPVVQKDKKGTESKRKENVLKKLYKVYSRSCPINTKEFSVNKYVYINESFNSSNPGLARRATVNTRTNDYPKAIVYYIDSYIDPSVTDVSNIKESPLQFSEITNSIKKIYNYTYSGLNDQVIDFDMNFKFAFYQDIPDAEGEDRVDAMGRYTCQQTFESINTTIPEDFELDFTNIPTDIPLTSNANNSDKFNTNMEGPPDSTRSYFNSILNQVMNKNSLNGDLLQVNMKIKGDPFWLSNSYDAGKPSLERLEYIRNARNTDANFNTTMPAIVFRAFGADEADVETGLISSASQRANQTISGLFYVIKVEHSFAGGQFMQTLDMARENRVNANDVNKFIDE